MNRFLKILQNVNSAATKPEQLLSRQASRHDKMWENRFGATQNQLHCHDREDESGDRGAYRCRRQQSKRQHDYAEGMPAQGRCQPANSDVLCGCLRSEEHTSELQSHSDLVCRLLLEKKKK